jgi:hypothetical protein
MPNTAADQPENQAQGQNHKPKDQTQQTQEQFHVSILSYSRIAAAGRRESSRP